MTKTFTRITSIITAFIFMLSFSITAFAVDETDTTVGLQMERLKKEISDMDQAHIDTGINIYTDVSKHWAKNSIGKMTQLGLLTGGGKSTFNPNGDMSIAAFIKVVVLALGYNVPEAPKGSLWYIPYVELAKKVHIIGDKDFSDYTKAITREQAGKIMYEASCLFEPAVENQNYFTLMRNRILDYAKIGNQYKDSFVKAYIKGYFILGDSKTCNPKGTFTRAQACTTIMRLLDDNERVKFEVLPDETYIDMYGNICYPAVNTDTVKAINVLMDSLDESKGYVYQDHRFDISVSYSFYESETERIKDFVLGNDMGVSIRNTAAPVNINWPVEIAIFNGDEYNRLHKLVLEELFKYLFGAKYTEALKVVDIALKADTYIVKDVKLNDRILSTWGNGGHISISITCKGGLTAEEFYKRYPDGM